MIRLMDRIVTTHQCKPRASGDDPGAAVTVKMHAE